MAQRRGIHGFIERTNLPLLIIVLIPIAAVLFWYFGPDLLQSDNSVDAQPPAATVNTTAAPAQVPNAMIALDDSNSLPATTSVGTFVPFSFTITNVDSVSGTIPFKVYVKWSTGEEDVIDENVVSLAPGASQTIPEQLKFEVAGETAQVYLELTQSGATSEFSIPSTN